MPQSFWHALSRPEARMLGRPARCFRCSQSADGPYARPDGCIAIRTSIDTLDHNRRAGGKIVFGSGMTAGLSSTEVLNLTATYTMFEAVEGVSRLIRQTQDAAGNSAAPSILTGSKEHISGARSAAGIVHRVQNDTGLSLECWIAPPSQPTHDSEQPCSPLQRTQSHILRPTQASLAQWQLCSPWGEGYI